MRRNCTGAGWIYAAGVVATRGVERGIGGWRPGDREALIDLARRAAEVMSNDEWWDDARCLLTAAQVLIEEADARCAAATGHEGEVETAVWMDDCFEAVDRLVEGEE